LLAQDRAVKTPVTAAAVTSRRAKIARHVKDLEPKVRHEFEKFANAAEGRTAQRDLLEHKTAMLEAENNEKVRRSGPTPSWVGAKARVGRISKLPEPGKQRRPPTNVA